MPASITVPTLEFDLSLEDAARLSGRCERTLRRWVAVGRRDRGALAAVHTVFGIRIRKRDLLEYLQPIAVGGLQPSRESQHARDDDALDRAVERVLASAPALSQEQRRQLGRILGSSR